MLFANELGSLILSITLIIVSCLSDFSLSGLDLRTRMQRFEQIQHTSDLLDNLLAGYDSTLKPDFDSPIPTKVVIDIAVRSMGPISELDSSYSMDCYFRQSWSDPRLTFSSTNLTTLSLGMSMLDKIWKPDTYFWNGKRSYLHKLTTPNKLVRLSQNGTVLFSSRLTIRSKCDMDLHSFPLDKQTCQLRIGSFAYRAHEIEYVWMTGESKGLSASNISLSQFSLVDTMIAETIATSRASKYSVLEAAFVLQRHGGYFVINFYVPATMIVLLSWVAFWINREATADRIGLGVTSMLTMTFLALDARSDLPRVTYPTALDIYIVICFSFLFCCIIEFAVVHTYTKYRTGDPEMYVHEIEKIFRMRLESAQRKDSSKPNSMSSITRSCAVPAGAHEQTLIQNCGEVAVLQRRRSKPLTTTSNKTGFKPPSKNELGMVMKNYCTQWSNTAKDYKTNPMDIGMNSVSKIDRVARALFPLSFMLISYIYWKTYLSEVSHGNNIFE